MIECQVRVLCGEPLELGLKSAPLPRKTGSLTEEEA